MEHSRDHSFEVFIIVPLCLIQAVGRGKCFICKKDPSVYLWPWKDVFVSNKHQIKMVKGLLISKAIFFTSYTLQFWCKKDRPTDNKKYEKYWALDFLYFLPYAFSSEIFLLNRERVPSTWPEFHWAKPFGTLRLRVLV